MSLDSQWSELDDLIAHKEDRSMPVRTVLQSLLVAMLLSMTCVPPASAAAVFWLGGVLLPT